MTVLSKWILWIIAIFYFLVFSQQLGAQCNTFDQAENGSEAKEAHVIYRNFIKSEKFNEALPYWKKAFEMAPAADGKRSTQYTDGVAIFTHKYKNETDESIKEEYSNKIIELYKSMSECYPKEKAFALGRMTYDLYYNLNYDRFKIYSFGKEAIEAGGNNTEYIVLIPLADGLVNQFKAGNVDQSEARKVFTQLQDIANYNIENNAQFSDYYKQSKDGMDGILAAIESDVFDCQYFKDKYTDQYKSDPDNRELYREIYKKLVQGGCDKEDPLLQEISKKDEAFLAAEKAAKIAELQESNPAWHANNLYKEGKYSEAVAKYDEAIANETDSEKKASYLFSKASIQFRKLNQYGAARSTAREAANLNSNWGRPYMLIGDMYGSSARSCGDSWNQRLAILAAVEKYSYAKSIDPEVASEANSRISKYRASYPEKNEGFMRGVKEGESAKVECWIGETVTVRFK